MQGSVELNKEQKEAVSHGKGPLLIIAGAGTGKTTVITERIKYLISQKLSHAAEVLALTFTDKAAREMEERVDIALPYGYTQMWILTFHSFCERILRNEAIHIGLNPGYKLMAQAETVAFFRKNIFKFNLNYFRPLGNPTKFVQGILQHFSRLKDEDVTPGQYLDWVKTQKLKLKTFEKTELAKWQELAKAYEQYEKLKAKEGLMDFGDLISNTLKLFKKRENVTKQYRRQFKYILVDEFQDTNIAQYELLKLLAPPGGNPNLTVVGDDSQSIYKFRGAAISNILSFMKDYPKARQVVLIKNYRSRQTILNHAYKLIKHNDPDTLEAKLGINKNLVSTKSGAGAPVKLVYAERVENEAEKVVGEIKKLTGYQYRDFAILVRANSHAEPFIRALRRAGIPYQFLGPGMLFKKEEVKNLIAYLKVLYNFEDSVSFYRVLSMPIFDLGGRDLTSLNIFARKYNFSLFEACEKIALQSNGSSHQTNRNFQFPFISQKTKETLTKIVKMINRHLKLAVKESAGQILYYFLEDSGLLKKLTDYKTADDEKKAQNISRFFDKLKTYETEHEDASINAVVDWLTLSLELGESPRASNFDWFDNNAVNILTVHSSKGLEFPVVFLTNLTVGRFPTYQRREQIPIPENLIKEILPEGDYHLEEERRLFYVGMTRAMERLYLTAANYYGAGKRERKLSPFVVEALGKKEIRKLQKREIKEKIQQLSFLDWKKADGEKPSAEQHPPHRQAGYHMAISYLSYSQMETFRLCPLKYKYKYILKIPQPANAAASFGQSIHETLKEFYQEIKRGKKATIENLLSLFKKNWLPLGYASKAHEAKRKEEGRKMLEDFYKKSFNPKQIPQDLEQVFITRISPVLKIGGKIDRVDKHEDGLEIIDYKTGKVPTQKQIEASLQLTIYALAAADPGIYGEKPENLTLSFYFLKNQEKFSTKRSKEDLIRAKKEIIAEAKEIETSSFKPKPGRYCDFCPYQFICPVWQE